jgi:hypothetical protein
MALHDRARSRRRDTLDTNRDTQETSFCDIRHGAPRRPVINCGHTIADADHVPVRNQ